MDLKDSNDDFTFTIEGKDYTISEKNNSVKKNQKQSLHIPSLTIGAVITGICIVLTAVPACSRTNTSDETSTSYNSPTQIPINTPIASRTQSPVDLATKTQIRPNSASPTSTPRHNPDVIDNGRLSVGYRRVICHPKRPCQLWMTCYRGIATLHTPIIRGCARPV